MGRALEDSDQLVGSAAIAERLGFKSSTLVHWWRTHDETFPDPLVRLTGNVMIWYWPDVAAWAKASTRLGSKARRTPERPAGEAVATAAVPASNGAGGTGRKRRKQSGNGAGPQMEEEPVDTDGSIDEKVRST